ncbi:toll-like receptor 2 [Anabrus simplex]|uniref:toll-like receptor 2 n=1 Tax=Anabrus simplex TaxID=316456 RepID=UPI0035A305EA
MTKVWMWPLLFLNIHSVLATSSDQFMPMTPFIYPATTEFSDAMVDGCTCTENRLGTMVCYGGCERFPNHRIGGNHLSVSTTAIRTVYVGDLTNLGHLKCLMIEYNSHLTTIEPGVFIGMDALESLSISFNSNLSYLSNGTFKGLNNLTELKLIQNNFWNIRDIALSLLPTYLPRLLNLSLNANMFSRIDALDLTPMNGALIVEMHLKLCQLEYIHPKAFRPLRHLRHLELCQNSLNETTLTSLVRQMTRDNMTVVSLNLGNMGFQKPPKHLLSAIGESGITSLSLDNNQFSHLRRGSFPKMPRLRYLNLQSCLIVNVDPGTFDEIFLPQLRNLCLAKNYITRLSSGILPVQVTELDISYNSYNKLQPINFILGEGNFVHMSNLNTLNISYVFLETITTKTFLGLQNLTEQLGLKNASISRIEPGSFRELKKLTFLNLQNNPLTSRTNLTAEIFEGLKNLEVLILIRCGISHFSDVNVFSPLEKLEYLMLDDNFIVKLYPEVIFPLKHLTGLSIEGNDLEPWTDKPIFQHNPNISKVFLANNKLTFLSYVMLEDFSKLKLLTLYNNMFICDCSAVLQARNWVTNGNNVSIENILFPTDMVPYCEAPEQWKYRELTIFLGLSEYEESCPENSKGIIWVVILLCILLTLGILCGVLGYKYRSYIRYWAFLARMDLRRRGMSRYRGRRKVVCKGYTNYQFDAFVSYSSEDRNFVVRLVAMLENQEPFLKLCVYERDFQIGTMISEAVLESVASSRRTLLIVSDAFAKSQWCMWELRLAEHHRLFLDDKEHGDRDDTLIIVKIGNVRSSNMTPTLKYLMRTRIYLEWDQNPKKQRIFWTKLRAALAPPTAAVKTSNQ